MRKVTLTAMVTVVLMLSFAVVAYAGEIDYTAEHVDLVSCEYIADCEDCFADGYVGIMPISWCAPCGGPCGWFTQFIHFGHTETWTVIGFQNGRPALLTMGQSGVMTQEITACGRVLNSGFMPTSSPFIISYSFL